MFKEYSVCPKSTVYVPRAQFMLSRYNYVPILLFMFLEYSLCPKSAVYVLSVQFMSPECRSYS